MDTDNLSSDLAPHVLAEAAQHGVITVRRVFGSLKSRGWQRALVRYAFHPAGRAAYTAGKNGSDIELAIAAVDLLHESCIDGFCLVTNDSDFAPIALRLREAGRFVVGMGGRRAATAFVQACDRFAVLDASAPPREETRAWDFRRTFKELLMQALARVPVGEDGWVSLCKVGTALLELEPGFQPWRDGPVTLLGLVESCRPEAETKVGPSGLMVRVRTHAGEGAPEVRSVDDVAENSRSDEGGSLRSSSAHCEGAP